MATTYAWSFPKLDVYPVVHGQVKVVKKVHWRMAGDDGAGHAASVYGEAVLNEYVPGDLFISFGSLTSTDIAGWVEAVMGGSEVAQLHAKLDRQIAQIIAPTLVTMDAPW